MSNQANAIFFFGGGGGGYIFSKKKSVAKFCSKINLLERCKK
jgi:hypothetical protein